jgi:hypothetical protein
MAIAFIGSLAVPAQAPPITITRVGNAIAATSPDLGVIKGDTLARLKDGRTVRVGFDLAVLPGPGGPAAARGRQTFVLSYDLWEERFAVTRPGPPLLTSSYLTAAAAEAWCLEHLTIPIDALGRLRDAPFWIRLEYRVLDSEPPPAADDGAGISLRALIDLFSRRARTGTETHAFEAGPFRIR